MRLRRFAADYSKPLDTLNRLAEAYSQTLCWGTDTPAYYFTNRWVDDRGREHRSTLNCEWDEETRALEQLDREPRRRIARENPLRFIAYAS